MPGVASGPSGAARPGSPKRPRHPENQPRNGAEGGFAEGRPGGATHCGEMSNRTSLSSHSASSTDVITAHGPRQGPPTAPRSSLPRPAPVWATARRSAARTKLPRRDRRCGGRCRRLRPQSVGWGRSLHARRTALSPNPSRDARLLPPRRAGRGRGSRWFCVRWLYAALAVAFPLRGRLSLPPRLNAGPACCGGAVGLVLLGSVLYSGRGPAQGRGSYLSSPSPNPLSQAVNPGLTCADWDNGHQVLDAAVRVCRRLCQWKPLNTFKCSLSMKLGTSSLSGCSGFLL